MVETGERNPPNPPNFVTLRQLRERRLAESQAQASRSPLLDRSSTEEKSDDRPHLPPNYVSLRQLRERRLKEEEERESGNGREESGNRPLLPPNYVSLRQLQAQRLKEEEEKGKGREREEEKVKEKKKEKQQEEEEEEEEEKGGNYPILPPNYVSLRQLKELRLQEKEQKEAEEKARLQQTKVQKEDDEPWRIEVDINNKVHNLARNLQSKKPDKLGCVKLSWVREPVLPPAGTSTSTGTSSADAMFLPENAGASREVVMASSDQNGDAEMNPKNKGKRKNKNKKKKNRKIASGKDKDESVKAPEMPMEVTDLQIDEAPNASSSATKEVTLSQNENNTVKKVNNLTESSSQPIPIRAQVKRSNRAQLMGFKRHNGRHKMKGKKVNLSEPSHNVVPMSEVAKGSDGVEEVIRTEIEDGKDRKGKGKMVDIPELSDQTLSHEEAKEVQGAGRLIGSEIRSGEEKGRGKNVDMPQSSKWRGQVGDHRRKRNQAAGGGGRGHPRVGRFPVRPAEHLRGGGGLVWVPKTSS